MTVPTTNVGFSSIQTEFGGSNPISLSEYYRGGSLVPTGTADGGFGLIATSGAISIGTFRNTSAVTTINLTVSTNSLNYNVRTAAGNPAGAANVTVTINSNVLIYGNTSATPSFTTGSGWAVGSTITVINNGIISGFKGDNGSIDNSGAGVNGNGLTGGSGGTAVQALFATTFTNNGTVAGGGGQGGFGGNGGTPGTSSGGAGGPGAYYITTGANTNLLLASQTGGAGGNGSGVGGAGQAGGFTTTSPPAPSSLTNAVSGANSSGGGAAGGGLGGAGASHTVSSTGRGRNASAVLTSIGGAAGAGGLRLSGLSFVNGGAGITTGTIFGSQA